MGNRKTGPKSTDSYTYDAANALQTYKGKLLLLNKTHRYEYDVNGNLIKKTETLPNLATLITTYAYDDENRLINVRVQRGTRTKDIHYAYDPFGRRISKTIEREELDDDNNIISWLLNKLDCPRTTYYIYDHQNIIAEYDQNNKQTATYIHGPNIDEPLSADIRNTRIYYHADGLGGITTLTNHMGLTVQKYDYDAFGNSKLTPFPQWIKQPYMYTAREYDTETGLYYYRARYYDPKAGRFITRDPIGFKGGDVNLYNYVLNNPVNYIDPSGHKVYNCIRPLKKAPRLIYKYLSLGHTYLWVDMMAAGYGLAPKDGYEKLALFIDVLGYIEKENAKIGTCQLITADPCREQKIKEIIETEIVQHHIYNLTKHNCYHWAREVLWRSW